MATYYEVYTVTGLFIVQAEGDVDSPASLASVTKNVYHASMINDPQSGPRLILSPLGPLFRNSTQVGSPKIDEKQVISMYKILDLEAIKLIENQIQMIEISKLGIEVNIGNTEVQSRSTLEN